MSVPLGKGDFGHGPAPTEHQLRMAHIRARATGESLSRVLSVFMGVGRHGPQAGAAATRPEAPLNTEVEEVCGQTGEDDVPQLAPVIPLSRAFRDRRAEGRSSQQDCAEQD